MTIKLNNFEFKLLIVFRLSGNKSEKTILEHSNLRLTFYFLMKVSPQNPEFMNSTENFHALGAY